MRAPPVRSYIHMLMPRARASFLGMTPPDPVKTGSRKGRSFTRCGALWMQALALGEGFVHEADLALLQVAEAAVGQLRGLRRGARREVVPLDQGRAQAAGGGVERRAHAGDATAHHQHVERIVAEAPQAVGAVEPRRAGHRCVLGTGAVGIA